MSRSILSRQLSTIWMITIGFIAFAFSIFRAVLGLPFINLDDLDQVAQNLEVIWGPMMLLFTNGSIR